MELMAFRSGQLHLHLVLNHRYLNFMIREAASSSACHISIMSVAHALFLTLLLLNYERWTRLVMVLGAPWGPWAVSVLPSPCPGVRTW